MNLTIIQPKQYKTDRTLKLVQVQEINIFGTVCSCSFFPDGLHFPRATWKVHIFPEMTVLWDYILVVVIMSQDDAVNVN